MLVDPELAARLRPALRFAHETEERPRVAAPGVQTANTAQLDRRRLAAAAVGGPALIAAGIVSAAMLTADPAARRATSPPNAVAVASSPAVAPTSAKGIQDALLARLGRLPGTAAFLDPATGLPRTNSAVQCVAVAGRIGAFACVVRSASGAKRAFEARVDRGSVRFRPR